jgi:hypothetical protein
MKKRPVPVTITGGVFIAAGLFGFVYHAREFWTESPPIPKQLWVLLLRLLAVAGGLYVLRGADWARWTLAGWMAYHVVLSAFHSFSEFAVHAVLLGLLGVVLFRGKGGAFFRASEG